MQAARVVCRWSWFISLNLLLGCGDEGTGVQVPALQVTTATTGVELDPDGYTHLIDGGHSQPLDIADTVLVERLSDGPHLAELVGVAPNCRVEGSDLRTVTVRTGQTVRIDYAITCASTAPSTGVVEITTTTNDPTLDPDGYTVVFDGTDRGSIGVNETVPLEGLAVGTHIMGLSGIAANCQVDGDNPQQVTISPGARARIAFSVSCSAPPPNTGTLEVTTRTNGPPDPDGYSLSVDQSESQSIGRNATVILANLAAGVHTVTLSGLSEGCQVEGSNPQSVTVTAGEPAGIAFTISCLPPAGTIAFVSTRDGNDEIYVMNAGGGGDSRLTNDPAIDRYPAWSPDGRRIAFISGRDGTTHEVYVMQADGRDVTRLTDFGAFSYSPSWSPDGGKIAFGNILGGQYVDIFAINADGTDVIRLTDDRFNDLSLAWSPDGRKIAFASDRDDSLNIEVMVMDADGSNAIRLTNQLGRDEMPAWSPDGGKIAFRSVRDGNGEIYVMNADGSQQTRLTYDQTLLVAGWEQDRFPYRTRRPSRDLRHGGRWEWAEEREQQPGWRF